MVLLIIFFIILVFAELRGILRRKDLKELIAFSVFILLAFILSTFYILKIHIFNPVDFFEYIIKDILHLNYG